MSLYTETAAMTGSGIGHCSIASAHVNHACAHKPDGVSSLELIWQWSTASGFPHAKDTHQVP
eukprot:COSAG05_NODE_15726_length_362_cov_3638.011407_1_plen_61_part_01